MSTAVLTRRANAPDPSAGILRILPRAFTTALVGSVFFALGNCQPRDVRSVGPTKPDLALQAAQAVTQDLPVEGFLPAVLSIPVVRSDKHPVLVAAHGAGGRAEWQCDFWRNLVGPRGFVLCPRGTRMGLARNEPDDGYFFRTHHALAKEVLAALQALRETHPGSVDDTDAAFAGFSQGAIMGSLMVQRHPERFRRIVLIEGGGGEWNVASGKKLARYGETRLLFACGTAHCHHKATTSARHLERGGARARVVFAAGAGHTYEGAVAQQVHDALGWLFEGDTRWHHRDGPPPSTSP